MLVWIFFMNTRRKLGLYAHRFGTKTPALGSAIPFLGEPGALLIRRMKGACGEGAHE